MNLVKYIYEFVKSIPPYVKNVRRCRNLNIFDYEELSSVEFDPIKSFRSVLNYGNYRAVANFKGRPFNFIRDYVEHGFNALTEPQYVRGLGHLERPGIRRVYTFGAYRRSAIENCLKADGVKHRKVYEMGPYILWADNQLSEKERATIKEKYGKILLVFPVHSFKEYTAEYGIESVIEEINSHKEDFQTVFVCMYWRDILSHPEVIERYKKEGYIIVSNGCAADPMFLSRQKDMIMLSDMVLANGIGTHIGYAIALDKPVYMLRPQYSYIDKSGKNHIESARPKQTEDVERMFFETFKNYDFSITQHQKDFIKTYFGEW